LASGKKQTSLVEQTAEGVELNRDVLAALAHELGGIASALDLRATAMSQVVSGTDLAALRDIAEQIRMATRAARFARGDSFGLMNPNRRQSLDDWWKLAERFTSSVLPRGIAVESQFDESFVTATQASSLTWLWLAGCKEVADRGVQAPARLLLRGGPSGNGTNGTTLTAELKGGAESSTKSSGSRWSRFSTAMAHELGSETPSWKQDDGMLLWSVDVPA
jgi:hypothetical protein